MEHVDDYLTIISKRVPKNSVGTAVKKCKRTKIEEIKLKDFKVKNYLFQAINRAILETP